VRCADRYLGRRGTCRARRHRANRRGSHSPGDSHGLDSFARPHDACLLVQDEEGQRCELAPDEFPRRLRQLLVPSSPLQPDLRETYFSETRPSWTLLGLLFKAFRNLVAEGRCGSLQIRVPDFIVATEEEWQQAWHASPAFPRTVAQQIDAGFRDHYAWADKLSVYYADLYRSSFVANYLMGGLAVLCALLA